MLGEDVDAHDLLIAGLHATTPFGVGGDELPLEVAGLNGDDSAAEGLYPVEFRPGLGHEARHLRLDDVRAVEDVVIFEEVGLVGEHLLHAQ